MEYPDESDFSKEFFKRTIYNLELYSKNSTTSEEFKYEVTQLINSLLGLIVFVKEDKLDIRYINLKDIVEIDPIVWKYCDRKGGRLEEKNFSNFLKHLRNAIAHKRLVIKSNEKEIYSVVFVDEYKNNKFKVELNIDQIYNLVDKLSESVGKN